MCFDRDISIFANGWTIEPLMLFYRVWHIAPFAFVIFYARAADLTQDTLESASSTAPRFERALCRHPALMPLIVFVASST